MVNILSIVVLYNQRLESCNTYNTLLSKTNGASIFIFDNSPIPQHAIIDFDNTNIHYVSDPSNPGLSYAYNRAAEYAKENGFEWMLLLDQDTFFAPNIYDEYISAINKYPSINLIIPRVLRADNLPMSPILNRSFFNCTPINIYNKILDSQRYSAINSGICVNVNAFFKVGGYNENVVLDLSDMQFFERFSRKYDSFYVMNSICIQEFSNDVHTLKQKLARYNIFCTCAKNYAKDGERFKLSYDLLVIKRALSLCIRNLSIKPIFIMLDKYFNPFHF